MRLIARDWKGRGVAGDPPSSALQIETQVSFCDTANAPAQQFWTNDSNAMLSVIRRWAATKARRSKPLRELVENACEHGVEIIAPHGTTMASRLHGRSGHARNCAPRIPQT